MARTEPKRTGRPPVEADQTALLAPIDAIQPGRNARSQWDAMDDRLVRLSESIEEKGILEPLLVRELHRRTPRDTHQFELIAGFRRFAAARHLALERVPVRVVRAADDEAVALNLAENLARADLDERDALRAVAQLQETYGWGVRKIARVTGRAIGWVSEVLTVARSRAEREGVERGQIALGGAARLVRLREAFPGTYAEWARRLEAGEHVPAESVPRLRYLQEAAPDREGLRPLPGVPTEDGAAQRIESGTPPDPETRGGEIPAFHAVPGVAAPPPAPRRVLSLSPQDASLLRNASLLMRQALASLHAAWSQQGADCALPSAVRESLEQTSWEIARALSREGDGAPADGRSA